MREQQSVGPTRPCCALHRAVGRAALLQQQGQRYVYVVTSEDKIDRRNVTVGRRDDSLRVIESGLEQGDRVVLKGQQRVRPGVKVKAETETTAVSQSKGS